MEINSLNILGFYAESLNILLELAENSRGIRNFNVLKNMPAATPERYVPVDSYHVDFFDCFSEQYNFSNKDFYALGVLGTKSKPKVYEFFKKQIDLQDTNFVNLIHSTSYVSPTAELNNGIQIDALTSVQVLAKIGFGVNIKNKCYIGHHVKIGDYVTINPGVTVSGFVEIGNHTLIGSGAIIRDGTKIGSNCIIGMGSNVVKDIPDNSIAFGNPCKVHRTNS